MNYSLPIENYLNNEIQNKVSHENPHKIIEDVLIELRNNINTLITCFEYKHSISEAKSNSYSKSLTAIYILQSSLDRENGGEIAENLNDLYDYCRRTIIKSFTNKDVKSLYSVLEISNEILEGWTSIKNI
jgi:flagellar protein FliS